MTPKKQVSPAIRILRGERDASARATHLEAATRKFLVTTNERKQMSTTTNFKRIALVAVAALGMGLLSSAPSQAAFSGTAGSQLTLAVTAGTGSLEGSKSDSTTAGVVTVSGLALVNTDSYTITSSKKSWPALTTGALTPNLLFMLKDTATSTSASFAKFVDSTTANIATSFTTYRNNLTTDSSTSLNAVASGTDGSQYVNASFFAYQESATGTDRIAGTYVYTIVVTPMAQSSTPGTPQTIDLTITVAALTSSSLVANAAFSSAFIGTSTGNESDAAFSRLATASDTPRGYITVKLRNSSGATDGIAARESVTITTTIGQVGSTTNRGRSVVLKYDSDSVENYNIYSDGTAGTGTITISTPSVNFGTKSVTFYAVAPATLVASVATPNLRIGSNADSVRVVAKDANGVDWAGTLYIYASAAADAAIAGAVRATAAADATACTWVAASAIHSCPVTGTAAGTAKFKVSNYQTAALATAAASGAEVTSNEVSVVVNTAIAATVKLEFDKATYAPGERARIYVTPLDSTGKAIAVSTNANLLASGGISTAQGLTFAGTTTTAESLTVVSITTKANSSSTTGARAGSMEYTVYMPVSGGTVTISATGGTSLPLAGRVAVTASATVTDSGAAALAAVNALATTVASLRTLITTLTNLVLKIQKKVKA